METGFILFNAHCYTFFILKAGACQRFPQLFFIFALCKKVNLPSSGAIRSSVRVERCAPYRAIQRVLAGIDFSRNAQKGLKTVYNRYYLHTSAFLFTFLNIVKIMNIALIPIDYQAQSVMIYHIGRGNKAAPKIRRIAS